MRRVCPRVWRCGLFVLAVGAAVLGLGVYNGRTAPTGPRTASEGTEVPGVGPDACAPLMRAFRGGNREVGLETEHGLVAAVMPSALAAEGIRSFSCLSDNLVGRVEMIVVSIGRDDEVAQLVIPHADMEDGAVRAYMREVAPKAMQLVVWNADPRVLLVVTDPSATSRLRRALGSPLIPLWDRIMDDMEGRGS